MTDKYNKHNAARLLSAHSGIFSCPLCSSPMSVIAGRSLLCSRRHCFDISRDGYINLLPRQAGGNYDKRLFAARKAILSSGLLSPVDVCISQRIAASAAHTEHGPVKILDAGCGEGSHLTCIQQMVEEQSRIPVLGVGLDISKAGIMLAAKNTSKSIWCAGDLANCPFNNGQFHTILSILSPSSYAEFHRLLEDDGILLKVIPEQGYLKELRQLLYGHSKERPGSRSDTMERFSQYFQITGAERLQYTVKLHSLLVEQLVYMTPLSWSAEQAAVQRILQLRELEITVDLTLLAGRKLR